MVDDIANIARGCRKRPQAPRIHRALAAVAGLVLRRHLTEIVRARFHLVREALGGEARQGFAL